MSFLVQKPQFDTQALKPGMAVFVTHQSTIGGLLPYDHPLRGVQTAAVLSDVEPLEITVHFYHSTKKYVMSKEITIEEVVAKTIVIEPMAVEIMEAVEKSK